MPTNTLDVEFHNRRRLAVRIQIFREVGEGVAVESDARIDSTCDDRKSHLDSGESAWACQAPVSQLLRVSLESSECFVIAKVLPSLKCHVDDQRGSRALSPLIFAVELLVDEQ